MKTPQSTTKFPTEKTTIPKNNKPFFKKREEKTDSISTKSIIRFWLIWGLFVCLGYRFYKSLDIIYLIISALIISISAEGLIRGIETRCKSRGFAIGISYFLLLLFVFSGVLFVIPFLISQISMMISWISKLIINIKDFVISNSRPEAINQLSFLPDIAKSYLIENRHSFNRSNADFQSSVLTSLNTLLESSTSYLKQFSSSIFSVIGGFFGMMVNLGLVFTTAIFFSIERPYLVNLMIKPVRKDKKETALAKVENIYTKLSLWLKARVYLSLFIFLAIYVSFQIMQLFGFGLPNSFSLALITGLLDIIPYVWPLFAMIPIAILALIHHGIWGMLIVSGIYLFIQRIQNNIIVPFLMGKQLWVNSVLVLISAMLGATVMGFRGIVLSVPLAVIIGLFIDEDKIEDTDKK